MRRFERYPEKPLAGLHPDPVVLLSSGAKPSWSQRSAQPARLCPEFARDAAGLGHQLRRRSCRLLTCAVTSSLPALTNVATRLTNVAAANGFNWIVLNHWIKIKCRNLMRRNTPAGGRDCGFAPEFAGSGVPSEPGRRGLRGQRKTGPSLGRCSASVLDCAGRGHCRTFSTFSGCPVQSAA